MRNPFIILFTLIIVLSINGCSNDTTAQASSSTGIGLSVGNNFLGLGSWNNSSVSTPTDDNSYSIIESKSATGSSKIMVGTPSQQNATPVNVTNINNNYQKIESTTSIDNSNKSQVIQNNDIQSQKVNSDNTINNSNGNANIGNK